MWAVKAEKKVVKKEVGKVGIKVSSLIVACLLIGGCSTVAQKYTVNKYIDGEMTDVEVIKLKGLGKGKFADGTEIEGEPILKFPELPSIKYEK